MIAGAVGGADVRKRLRAAALAGKEYDSFGAVLQIVGGDGGGKNNGKVPFAKLFSAAAGKLANEKNNAEKAPPTVTLPSGTTVCRRVCCENESVFSLLENLRGALDALPKVKKLAVDVRPECAPHISPLAVYSALVYYAQLPGDSARAPEMVFAGAQKTPALSAATENAYANTVARVLTKLPPNILTPGVFAKYAAAQARAAGISARAFGKNELQKLGAGLFLAASRASREEPVLLRLRYRPKNARRKITLVGKGVTFDTGGVNLKPAKHMRGMAKDMAGAAAVFSAALCAARERLPLAVDAWLALAENAIGADGYRPDEVIKAANGKLVEIVHTDAEGRMLLADSLAIATKDFAADKIVTMATLTGTMHAALGERMSGFFTENAGDRELAAAAGESCGERLCWFRAPEDYREELKSGAADIKQCAEEGAADHIMAVLFLREFIKGGASWVHLDLSAASREGGLAAAPGPVTGFGAAALLEMLRRWAAN